MKLLALLLVFSAQSLVGIGGHAGNSQCALDYLFSLKGLRGRSWANRYFPTSSCLSFLIQSLSEGII